MSLITGILLFVCMAVAYMFIAQAVAGFPFPILGFLAAIISKANLQRWIRILSVLGGVRYAVFAADVLDLCTRIGFLEDRNNLCFAEFRRSHLNLLTIRCQKALLMSCPPDGEAYDSKPGYQG